MKVRVTILLPLFWASFSIRVLGGTYCEPVQAGSYHYVSCNVSLNGFQMPSLYIYAGGLIGFSFDTFDGVWTPATPSLARGQGAVVQMAGGGANQICFNEPAQPPTLPLQLVAGPNLVSCQSNIVAHFEDIVGRAPVEGARFARYVGGSVYDPFWPPSSNPFEATNFVSYFYTSGAWQPSVPVAAIGEAVWVSEPAAFVYQPVAFNPRITGGSLAFEVETVYGKAVTIEVTDALPPSLPPSWQVLTSFIGDGHRKTILDLVDGGGSIQRYYRIKSTSP